MPQCHSNHDIPTCKVEYNIMYESKQKHPWGVQQTIAVNGHDKELRKYMYYHFCLPPFGDDKVAFAAMDARFHPLDINHGLIIQLRKMGTETKNLHRLDINLLKENTKLINMTD